MARRERSFRKSRVTPFLKTLKNTWAEPIAQVSIRGTPDYILCSHGTLVGLELKDGEEKPNPLQEFKGKEIVRCGGIYIVARKENWEAVKSLLLKLDKGEQIDEKRFD